MPTLRERIDGYDGQTFLDSAIISVGYAPHFRDFDVVIERPASKSDCSGEGYVEGRHRYRFTHSVEVSLVTAVTDESWQRSWDDLFTDYEAWEQAGDPSGFVWGVRSADAYEGLSYVRDSALAQSWSERLGQEMHEVLIESNTFTLRLVCHDLRVNRMGEPGKGN